MLMIIVNPLIWEEVTTMMQVSKWELHGEKLKLSSNIKYSSHDYLGLNLIIET